MCCNNIRPSLSIAPPIEELHSRGSEEDNDEGFGGNTGPLPIKKAPRELPKEPPTPSSSRSSGKGNTSSRVKQKGLIQDFFSGCVCEERDHTWFQQQAQLTSLAHKFKSSWAKDHQIMELSEKLEKKHNELYQAQLENVRLQQALVLRSVGRSVRRGRWGVCPECRQGVAEICRAISKQVQRSDAGIEVDVMHTGNELKYRALDKGLYDKRMYCRALDKGLQERRGEEYRD
jgi:hypothetical protein